MKKSDLQNGMIVECENGARYMAIRNFNEYTTISCCGARDVLIGIDKDSSYMELSDYNEDLRIIGEDMCGYSIAKVGYPKHFCCPIDTYVKWIWERKRKANLTEDEKTILKNIDKSWAYIARNKSGELCIATDDMYKNNYYWDTDGIMDDLCLFNHLFQFIKWEDDEPYDIDDLLKANGVER